MRMRIVESLLHRGDPIESAAHKEHAIHNLNRQPVQVITRTEAIRWNWSFAESSIDPFFCFSNKLLFRSLFRFE